jgi:hypothetical protein
LCALGAGGDARDGDDPIAPLRVPPVITEAVSKIPFA